MGHRLEFITYFVKHDFIRKIISMLNEHKRLNSFLALLCSGDVGRLLHWILAHALAIVDAI